MFSRLAITINCKTPQQQKLKQTLLLLRIVITTRQERSYHCPAVVSPVSAAAVARRAVVGLVAGLLFPPVTSAAPSGR